MDLNFLNVEDPDQWENADLAEIDLALRCNVCKEFLDPAMILPCSHNFCSLCIRRCLAADPSCPACRAPARESNLNKNVALDNIVRHFRNVRSHILSLVTSDNNAKRLPQPVPEPTAERPSERVSEPTRFPRAAKSRRKPPVSNVPQVDHAFDDDPIIEIDSETDERESYNHKDDKPRRSKRSRTSNDIPPESKDESAVLCPICGRTYPMLNLNKHLDRCLEGKPDEEELLWSSRSKMDATLGTTRPTKASRLYDNVSAVKTKDKKHSTAAARAPKKIRRPYYHLLKLKDLKKILAEHFLPNDDDAASMERRHREFVNLWNANCDSSNPKDLQTIVKEVVVWERTRNKEARDRGKATSITVHGATGEATSGNGAFGTADIQKHSLQYKDQFEELLKKARSTAPKPVATTRSSGDGTATTSTLPQTVSFKPSSSDTTASTTSCRESVIEKNYTTPMIQVSKSSEEELISTASETTAFGTMPGATVTTTCTFAPTESLMLAATHTTDDSFTSDNTMTIRRGILPDWLETLARVEKLSEEDRKIRQRDGDREWEWGTEMGERG